MEYVIIPVSARKLAHIITNAVVNVAEVVIFDDVAVRRIGEALEFKKISLISIPFVPSFLQLIKL